jgi:hypothetical protein
VIRALGGFTMNMKLLAIGLLLIGGSMALLYVDWNAQQAASLAAGEKADGVVSAFTVVFSWRGLFTIFVTAVGSVLVSIALTRNCYCADCGQFIGYQFLSQAMPPCGRCGCNRYVYVSTGVGRTFRQR